MKYGVFFTSLLLMTALKNIEAIEVFETFPGRKTYSCHSFCITIEISQTHKHPSDILHICFMPWNTWISRNICICKCMHALPLHAVLWWLHLTVLCTHLIIKHYTRTHLVLTFHCTVVCMFFQCRLFVCFFAAIKEKHSDWTEFLIQDLTGARTAPANLLEGVSVCLHRQWHTREAQWHTNPNLSTI